MSAAAASPPEPEIRVSPPLRRVGSAEHFQHKALGIVEQVMRVTAERNERAMAVARIILAVAFSLRLIILFPEDLLAGQIKDWAVLIAINLAGLLSVLHLVARPTPERLPWRQRLFIGVDLAMVVVTTFPALLDPEPGYLGLLMAPFLSMAVLISLGGGLRLKRRYAVATSGGVLMIFFVSCWLDADLNGDVIRWGIGQVVYFTVVFFGAGLLSYLIADRTLDIATRSAAKAIDAERARERLGSYVGREVAEEALAADEIVLGGARQPVAVLFSDLRGFTTYSERLPPEDLVHQLNAYLEEMVAVITRHGGVVDKYIGDGIMAVFGAPRPRDDDARRAILAARDLHLALIRHNQRRSLQQLPPLKMGIGVHYGSVVAGNIGTLEHAQYTIIGDTVNLASRLEAATKDIGVDVLVSRAAKDAAGDLHGQLTPLGNLAVRGRSEAVEIFTLTVDPPRPNKPEMNVKSNTSAEMTPGD